MTLSRVRELLDYESTTGMFRWRVDRRGGAHKGDRAGYTNTKGKRDGYHHIMVDGKFYMAHRLAWLYMFGHWPKQQIDHINGDPVDNRIANLRDVNQSTNQHNRHRLPKNNTSGCLNVVWDKCKQRWKVSAPQKNGHRQHLGYYRSWEQAKNAAVKRSLT